MDPMSPEAHGWSVLQKLNEQKSMGLFCDVSLMVEGKIFLAHKNVLSACSEYFYSALKRNEQQQFLVLDNVSLEGFSHLLDFIYTYKIPTCHVQDFMQASQQLQVSLPLTSQVVTVSSSPSANNSKEEICIPEDDEVPDQKLQLTEVDTLSSRRNYSDHANLTSNIHSEERRRFETKSQLKDQTRMHKRPSFYKEQFAVRNAGYFMHKPAAKSSNLGRASPVEEAQEHAFLSPGFSRQMPITIHNDGSSEEADDDTADICINLCDEPDTPDHLEPTAHRDLGLLEESVKPQIYTTVVGLQGGGVVERVGGEENLGEVLHKCDRCELLLPYPEFLNHQDDPGINLLQCSVCDKQFNYSCQLALHQSSHHDDKQFYQCSQCGKELSTLNKLHDHIAYHSEARPHKCHLCDKAYKVKSDLTQHIKVKHVEASPGKTPLLQLCEFCGQAVKHYKSHKIFCSGVKKFKCDFCVQSFHRISELKRHTWTHTGELPYRCKICGKGCRHPSNMKKHIRTVHKADMRVQINREHASPRFCKNRRPAGKCLAPAEVQPASHSLPVPVTATDQTVQRNSSVSPISMSYIPVFTGDEQLAHDIIPYDSQSTSATVRSL